MHRYPSTALRRYIADVLLALGMPADDAELGARILHDADLAGVDTHGIVNLARHDHYAPGLSNGAVEPNPIVTVLRDAPVAAAWDSGRGFGPVVAHRAMETAIAKATATGVGMVTVRDARHFGANGYFVEMAARRGLMAMVVANSPASSFPPGGTRPVVGPCPLGFAAPFDPPLVLDISMTAVAGAKVMLAERAGDSVPEGWVVDADGGPTTDPGARARGGGLELLGGPVAGHKGYGLALMVESLAMLSGNGAGVWQSGRPLWTQGQWFAAWRPDLFVDPDELARDMRRLADHIHDTPARDGRGHVHLPGEQRALTRSERAEHGIPLSSDVVADLLALGAQNGVAMPAALPT